MMDFNTTPMPTDMGLFIGINGNNRGWIGTESDYYDQIDREFAEDSPFFAGLADYRSNLKLRRFTINEYVYFEYWGRHEWEFTFHDVPDERLSDAYFDLLMRIGKAYDRKGIRLSELKAFLAKCAVLLADIKLAA